MYQLSPNWEFVFGSNLSVPHWICAWWFGTWLDYFSHIGNFIVPSDFNSIIFQRGRSTTNQNLFLLRSTPTKILATRNQDLFVNCLGDRMQGGFWMIQMDRTRMISGSFKSGMNVLTPRLCSIQLLPLRLIQPPFLIVCSSSDGEITIFG